MLISVIIPCFNQAEFLGEAIDSVLAQPIKNLEIIVINDGSTDNTHEVAKSYLGITCISQENKGLARARNRGFRKSCGDYIVFLDADDQLGPNALEAGLESLFSAPSAVFTYGAMQTISIDGRQLAIRMPLLSSNHYRDLLANNFIPTPGMVMFRRAALDKYGLFDPAVPASADYDIYLRMIRQEVVASHSEIAVLRRFHANAMTGDPGLMLQTTLKVHNRQRREAYSDKDLKKSFKTGRRFWKTWYGDQVLTVLRINIYQRKWRFAIRDIMLLARFRTRALWWLLTQKSKSNSLTIKTITRASVKKNKDTLQSNDAKNSNASGSGISITSLHPERIEADKLPPVLLNKFVLITVECKRANKCAQLYIDNLPMDTIWVNSHQLVGCFPVGMLEKDRVCEIFFIS